MKQDTEQRARAFLDLKHREFLQSPVPVFDVAEVMVAFSNQETADLRAQFADAVETLEHIRTSHVQDYRSRAAECLARIKGGRDDD